MTTTCPACRSAIEVPARTRDGDVTCGACGHAFTPTAVPIEPAPAPQQFPVIPFTPSRGGSAFGVGVAAFFGLLAALAVGVGAALLRSHFWLVLVFPFVHGILVGVPAGFGARLAKSRYRTGVGVVAAGCGLLSYSVLHYLFYLAFVDANPNLPDPGFWGYMDLRATEGVKLGKAGANGAGIGYVGSVIYWLVEAAVTAGGAAAFGSMLVGSPYCEGCDRWKTSRQWGPYRAEPGRAVPAVGAGVPAGLLAPADGGKKTVAVQVYACPKCGADGTLDVKASGSHQDGKKILTWNCFVTYPGAALSAFEDVERAARELGLTGKKK